MIRDEHERVTALVRRFAADMRQTTGLDVEVTVSPSGDGGVRVTVRQAGEWVGHPDADPLDWVTWLVDAVQHDWVVEQVHGAWPRCPRHAHPLVVRRAEDDVLWSCPAEPELAAPVGSVATLVAPA